MSRIAGASTKYTLTVPTSQFVKLSAYADHNALVSHVQGRATIAATAVAADEDGSSVTLNTPFYGSLTAGDDDVLTLSVVAGQTYSVSLRGNGPNAVSDTLLAVLNAGQKVINVDDDGGIGTNSLITFTAATSGTYFLYAAAFDNGDGGGIGDYRIDVRSEGTTVDVPDTLTGAATLSLTDITFGFIGNQPGPYEDFGDVDTYKITLEAGKYYTFQVAGGADYDTDYTNVPSGELDTALLLYDSQGNLVTANDDNNFPNDISSGLGFLATQSGTYYLDVTAYAGQRGGYTLTAQEVNIADLDPLQSIRWVNAANIPTTNNVATVYFAVAGENFGEKADDGTSPLVSYGWNDYEKGQVMAALAEYSTITGITYQITTEASSATFRLVTTTSEEYGAYFYPRDPSYGTQQGIGAFNVDSGGWSLPGQASLQQGGYAFAVILHEFGHAHGLAHPHDNGGGSDIMLGVTGPDSLGIYDLNQGVYTVMSYNDAWETNPAGESPYTRATVGFGWSGGLSAFDIAVLQERYGVHAAATGDTVYTLKDVNAPGTYYEAIWDTGGTDEIRYDGAVNTRIDLLAATLDYSPTGGGVVSFVNGIYGGYTIANGVVIENATGGAGNDVLLGNAAANVLRGNAGNDTMMGREGSDTLDGGLGADRLDGGAGDDVVYYDALDINVTGGAGRDTLLLRSGETVNLGNYSTSQILGKSVSNFEDVDASLAVSSVTLNGSDNNNILIGSALDDTLSGGGGFDVLTGGAGNDTLDGGADIDRVDGGSGDDCIVYDAADSSVQGGAGSDTLVFRSAATVNLANVSISQIAGRSVYGFENIDASGSSAAITVDGSQFDNLLAGGSGADTLRGGAGSDVLTGGGGSDVLEGGADADRIDGGAGVDRLDGGDGDDIVVYDALDTSVRGGAGADTLVFNAAGTINLGNFSTSQITGRSVFGFESVDAAGASGPVNLSGSLNNNVLIGGLGADTINGGGGYDRLTGGAGDDRFVFDSLANAASGRATITDFAAGDRIDLSGIDAVTGGGDNAFSFIGTSSFSRVAGQLRYQAGSGGQIVQGDVNGDGIADFSILVLASTIQSSYFVL